MTPQASQITMEFNNTGSSSMSSSCKSVQFKSTIRVRRIERLDAALWYSPQEVRAFRQEDAQIVHLMNHNVITPRMEDEFDEYCTRGLESRTCSGLRRKQRNRLHASRTVMEEQEDQFIERMADADFLADLYASVSAHAQKEARQMALKDEKYVRALDTNSSANITVNANTSNRTKNGGLLRRAVRAAKNAKKHYSSRDKTTPAAPETQQLDDLIHRRVAGSAA